MIDLMGLSDFRLEDYLRSKGVIPADGELESFMNGKNPDEQTLLLKDYVQNMEGPHSVRWHRLGCSG